uniref:Uncharacterized protein n=1 Tax=Avena sativa TaxID=4498 RepID=A0ACD5W6Q8_AVESA
MVSSPAPEEGTPASPVSKNVEAGNGCAVASPVRHMHTDVAEILLAAGSTARRRRRNKPAADEVHGRRAQYHCAFEEDEVPALFTPPRLVWAKVRGQVFAPADASAPALREKRHRDAVLVACFGDRTFLWADAEDLLPFRHGFPRLADVGGRSSTKSAFAPALNDALDEVARRVDAGLSCGCDGAANASVRRQQVFVNSGVRRGARGATADGDFARDALRGEAFVGYVRALAVAPGDGAGRLDLAVAAAQLKAFARWRSAAANPEQQDSAADGAMVVAARAGRGRATTPTRERTRRGLFPAADAMTLSMCPRAAAADVAFMRHMFPGEAVEEYASTTAARAELRGLAVVTTAQRKALDQWKSPSPIGINECTATRGMTEIVAHDKDAEADPGNCRTGTSCISSGEDDGDDDGWETESEDLEPPTFEWELGLPRRWTKAILFRSFPFGCYRNYRGGSFCPAPNVTTLSRQTATFAALWHATHFSSYRPADRTGQL